MMDQAAAFSSLFLFPLVAWLDPSDWCNETNAAFTNGGSILVERVDAEKALSLAVGFADGSAALYTDVLVSHLHQEIRAGIKR